MAAQSDLWDCIVVGAGVVGCSAAYHLSTRTLLLEQFPLPHTRGSSAGQSRIIRNAYAEERYAQMMPEAFKQWRHLEAEFGETLLSGAWTSQWLDCKAYGIGVQWPGGDTKYHMTKLDLETLSSSLGGYKEVGGTIQCAVYGPTGYLCVEGGQRRSLQKFQAVMTKYGMPHETLTPGRLREQYPLFEFPDDHHAVLDTAGGILVANKCLTALQHCFVKNGGRIQDKTRIVDVKPGVIVTLTTDTGVTYRARHVIMCAGPWSHDLLAKLSLHLPLTTMPGLHAYWRLREPWRHQGVRDFPILSHEMATPQGYWFVVCFPSYEYPGMVKVAMRREPSHRYCHPDSRDSAHDDFMVSQLSSYVERYIPALETTPSIRDPCMYTMTPDRDFILDRHPKHRNIVFAAGMSGHGFKLAPVLGQLLCELLQDKVPSFDISHYAIRRFQQLPSRI